MLAFLLHAASSSKLPTDNLIKGGQNSDQDKAVYFDILVRLIFYPCTTHFFCYSFEQYIFFYFISVIKWLFG